MLEWVCKLGRRSKLEIMINVLNVIQAGETKPTRIMYGANLSWKICSDILESLVLQELVETMDTSESLRKRDKRTSIVYSITPKGQNVLRYFHSAKTLMGTKVKSNPFQIT
jgi:predicted transcriptional regulator